MRREELQGPRSQGRVAAGGHPTRAAVLATLIGLVGGALAAWAYLDHTGRLPDGSSEVTATLADKREENRPSDTALEAVSPPPASPTAEPPPADVEPPPAPPRETRPTPRPAEERRASAPAEEDLSGKWIVATRVESSALERFEGLRLGYEVELEHDGDRITGVGYKVSENGAVIRPAGRTPIRVQGTSEDDRLTLSFVERGTRRASSGTFVLFREGDDRLRGRFATDAARSSGTVEAYRRE